MLSPVSLRILAKMIRTPDILATVLQTLWRRRVSANWDYYFSPDGWSRPFRLISIKITNACNLSCKMCAQWGETGYNFDRPSEAVRQVVPTERYLTMVDEVAHLRPHFYIWGGEPFLYPGLLDVMRHMKRKKLILNIVTNGVKLASAASDLVEMGLDALMLSMDGPEDVHDRIRGLAGCWDTLVGGIRGVVEARRAAGTIKPYIVLLVTISKDNISCFDQILDIGAQLGVDCVTIYYSWFTTEEIGRDHTRIMEQKLGCTPSTWKGYVREPGAVDLKALSSTLHRIRSRRYPFPYIFLPHLKPKDVERYYLEPREMFGYNRCIAPWVMTDLMPNGDVVTCRDYSDYRVGSILEGSLLQIFNNEEYRKFRRVLKERNGLFPICARCCGLMGY